MAKTGVWDRRVEGGGGHGKNCLAPASGKSARALLASVDDILGLSLSSLTLQIRLQRCIATINRSF